MPYQRKWDCPLGSGRLSAPGHWIKSLSAAAIALSLTLSLGCSGVPLLSKSAANATPSIHKRKEEQVRRFEEVRDRTEYQAAQTRWTQQHDAKGCREGLEKLLARNPRHRDAHLLMTEVLLEQEDSQAAYAHAKAALDIAPNDAEVQYTMGVATDALGQSADALGYFERAAKMDPRNETFAAAYQSAQEMVREQMPGDRSVTLDRGGKNRSAEPHGEVQQAGYATTAVAADSSAGNNPAGPAGDPADLLRKGQDALAADSPQVAIDCFRQAVAAKPDNPQIPLSAAAAALRANRPEMAVELLAAAAKQFPTCAAIHRMLGAAYYRAGDYPSSQLALQQALSLDKSSALSYLLMGCTLAKLGQQQAAENHFRQARTLDPRYTVTR
ncbi:MAG: tetratricopeptide repeat protein [Thermoguttaceae bacterium]